MRFARAEKGVCVCGPGASNPRITAYHQGTAPSSAKNTGTEAMSG